MKNRSINPTYQLFLCLSLTLFFSSCNRDAISSATFSLLVKQCNNPALTPWPRALSIDVYYFSPETNMDEAFDEVSQERYSPSETIEPKPADADSDGNFKLKLKSDQVVILFLHTTGFPNLYASAQLETTYERSGEICVTYHY